MEWSQLSHSTISELSLQLRSLGPIVPGPDKLGVLMAKKVEGFWREPPR